MPVDFSAPEGTTTPQNEGSMFAPTPLWERQPKGRRRRAAPATRDPALEAGEPASAAGLMGATPETGPADPGSDSFSYGAIRSERPRNAAPTGAIAAGVAVVAAVAALGWYMNRPHDTGVPELTPGSSEIALAAPPPASPLPTSAPGAPPGAPVGVTAATEAARREAGTQTAGPSAGRSRSQQTQARAPVSRVRPAPARTADGSGVDASATVPMIAPPAPTPAQPTGPTVNMPPERIAPSLDPAAPANSAAPSTTAPATAPSGDATIP